MTDEEESHKKLSREVFGFLEYANMQLRECISVLLRSTDGRDCERASRELLRMAEWRRQGLRVAVRLVELLPPAMRASFDHAGLLEAVDNIDTQRPAHLDGFCAEKVKFVEGPVRKGQVGHSHNRPTRWVYDFEDKNGWGIRISLPHAIDDLWHGEGGDGQRKEKSQ